MCEIKDTYTNEVRHQIIRRIRSKVFSNCAVVGKRVDITYLCKYIEKDVNILFTFYGNPYIPSYISDLPEVTTVALKANPAMLGLQYKHYKNVKKFALIAVKSDGESLKYVSRRLRSDLDILTASIISGVPFYHLPLHIMKENLQLQQLYCKYNPQQFSSMPTDLQTEQNCLICMKNNEAIITYMFYHLSAELQQKKSIALLAVSAAAQPSRLVYRGYPPKFSAYSVLRNDLKYDKDIIKAAILADSDVMYSYKWMARWLHLTHKANPTFIDEITLQVADELPENLILFSPELTKIVSDNITNKAVTNEADTYVMKILNGVKRRRRVTTNLSSSFHWYRNIEYWPRNIYLR